MKDRYVIIKLLSIMLLYYISNGNSLFLYAVTYNLYNIYSSCFKHITLKETFAKLNNNDKLKILKQTAMSIIVVCVLFIMLSILQSDTINVLLDIENTFLPYVIMSISVITEPLVKITLEYLESYNKPKLSKRLLNAYYIMEVFFLLIIGITTIIILKFPIHISISLLYVSKILSCILTEVIVYFVLKKENITLEKDKIESKISTKKILKTNSQKSIIYLVKNSYYYISIIVLYMILSTKYSYNIDLIEEKITFIYLYALTIIDFVSNRVLLALKNIDKKSNIINYILTVFKAMVTIAIITSVTSPLLCKILFNETSNSIYLMMLSFLSIFITLYDITFENIKNNKIIYISLVIGIISKIILIVPLINSFYRMGYNLVYGDIVSTIISMFISITINYIYLTNKNKNKKTLEKILTTLYESILLCIILVVLQFIIPIKTDNYIMSLLTFVIYISISAMFLIYKKKKRG